MIMLMATSPIIVTTFDIIMHLSDGAVIDIIIVVTIAMNMIIIAII